MPARENPIGKLQERRGRLLGELAHMGDMRPGSLVERYRRCGKPNCRCAREGETGHGPSFSLTHAVKGKTVTKVIPAHAVSRTREQIAQYRRFRALGQELLEVSERLCDARLREPEEAAANEAAKKGASKRRSTPKSSRKSTS